MNILSIHKLIYCKNLVAKSWLGSLTEEEDGEVAADFEISATT
jgi:hypothetical protein